MQSLSSNHKMYRSKQLVLFYTHRGSEENSALHNLHVILFMCLVDVAVFLFLTQSVRVKCDIKGTYFCPTVANYGRELHKQRLAGESPISMQCASYQHRKIGAVVNLR